MSLRPADSLSLRWDTESSGARPTTARGASSTTRIDPVQMQPAGMRLPVHERQRASVPQSPAFRETAALALSGGGPPMQPNTPVRGVGGNSSMQGILSTPTAVPMQDVTPARTPSRPLSSLRTRSNVDLSDRTWAPEITRAEPTPRAQGIGTRSSVVLGGPIEPEPVHTGKAMQPTHRAAKSSIQFGAYDAPQHSSRPDSAAARKNQSSIRFGGEEEKQQVAAGASSRRTQSTSLLRSDIFFQQPADEDKEVRRATGKAHIVHDRSRSAEVEPFPSSPLPPSTPQTSRRNQSSADNGIFGSHVLGSGTALSAAALRASAPHAHGSQGQHAAQQILWQARSSSAGAQEEAADPESNGVLPAPPNSSGSLIPSLRLSALTNQGAGITPVPVAAGVASSRQGDPSLAPSSRRVYNNARNASSLFQSPHMERLQPQDQAPKQAPDLPPPPKHHLKIIRPATANSVKNMLVWE